MRSILSITIIYVTCDAKGGTVEQAIAAAHKGFWEGTVYIPQA